MYGTKAAAMSSPAASCSVDQRNTGWHCSAVTACGWAHQPAEPHGHPLVFVGGSPSPVAIGDILGSRFLPWFCPSLLAVQNIPVADAKPDDIKDLLGGALFKALYKWFTESGPVYLLPTGPVSSFLVISDPAAAKHVLRGTDNNNNNIYDKGLVAEVSKFLFGDGFAVACGEQWRVRRRAVAPAFHRYVTLWTDCVLMQNPVVSLEDHMS